MDVGDEMDVANTTQPPDVGSELGGGVPDDHPTAVVGHQAPVDGLSTIKPDLWKRKVISLIETFKGSVGLLTINIIVQYLEDEFRITISEKDMPTLNDFIAATLPGSQ